MRPNAAACNPLDCKFVWHGSLSDFLGISVGQPALHRFGLGAG